MQEKHNMEEKYELYKWYQVSAPWIRIKKEKNIDIIFKDSSQSKYGLKPKIYTFDTIPYSWSFMNSRPEDYSIMFIEV
jgi:hypothetical protein